MACMQRNTPLPACASVSRSKPPPSMPRLPTCPPHRLCPLSAPQAQLVLQARELRAVHALPRGLWLAVGHSDAHPGGCSPSGVSAIFACPYRGSCLLHLGPGSPAPPPGLTPTTNTSHPIPFGPRPCSADWRGRCEGDRHGHQHQQGVWDGGGSCRQQAAQEEAACALARDLAQAGCWCPGNRSTGMESACHPPQQPHRSMAYMCTRGGGDGVCWWREERGWGWTRTYSCTHAPCFASSRSSRGTQYVRWATPRPGRCRAWSATSGGSCWPPRQRPLVFSPGPGQAWALPGGSCHPLPPARLPMWGAPAGPRAERAAAQSVSACLPLRLDSSTPQARAELLQAAHGGTHP